MLRWRLARLIAPEPIMADPFPDDAKVTWITAREGGMAAHFRAATLDIELRTSLPSWGERGAAASFEYAHREGSFSGTLG